MANVAKATEAFEQGGLTVEEHRNPAYLMFMLFLSLFALCMMALELTDRIAPGSKAIIEYVDNLVCLLFFLDFVREWGRPLVGPRVGSPG